MHTTHMTRATRVWAIISMLLGLVHLGMAPLVYRSWTLDALWFVGTGLAIVIAGAANVVDARSRRVLLTVSNLACSSFFAAAWPILKGPQVIIGALVFLSLAVCTARSGT